MRRKILTLALMSAPNQTRSRKTSTDPWIAAICTQDSPEIKENYN